MIILSIYSFSKYACLSDLVDDSDLTEQDQKDIDRYSYNFISWPPGYFEEHDCKFLSISERSRAYLAEVQRLGTQIRSGNLTKEENDDIQNRLELAGRKNCFARVMEDIGFYETYEEFVSYMRE